MLKRAPLSQKYDTDSEDEVDWSEADAESTEDVVKLLDFNPFGTHTDSLLFDWEELENFKTTDQAAGALFVAMPVRYKALSINICIVTR
ncbi:hypothetical protein HPB50_007385 [Hyalomma asiaticum]|uniref:Uncharacterized protein n=1 Tax=Hyalomma asiaticum TaxID=266040 RepID=A0ACB7RYZ9_HYAAI|nr:hypothetical protein HPB50_007385 [Hyalomma asiaticum]